ncbi:efflux RND transporter permease subunit [Thaumasiovibrio subtropicus]|uniref:efflux RND transporter permease subunit n=1 Tax=Thaumasiovibrio subtropicus TaxID=1891207 RepID=UPI000B35EFFF|nr:efflux RND transporter permease subunit [Thaumasiovibrio subtropicus]
MRWLSRWFLDNPVAANLLMIAILVCGVLSMRQMRVESFPQVPPTSLSVTVTYPGGTAKQVDEGITQRIEQAIADLSGIKTMTSESMAGYASVTIRKRADADLERLLEDVRNRVSAIVGFPTAAETPKVTRMEFTNLAAFVVISGARSDADLQPVAYQVEQALLQHPLISKVSNWGARSALLVIEPDPIALKRYGMSIGRLSESITQASFETRSGELKSDRGRLVVKGDGYAQSVRELEDLVVLSQPSGVVRLSDVATLRRDFEETGAIVRNNGNTAIALQISTSQQDNLLRVSEAIQEVLEEQRYLLPDDIALDTLADMAPYISEQLNRLGTNAWQGLLIVLALLGLFLNLRLAFWVAVGIPVSVAGALAMMGWFDYSINDITLFGLILVLGILVDDAVVVGESIHDARSRHSDPKEAAWHGVEAVTVATVFGVLTTIAAFSPMLWINNEIAKILAGFSAVVIFALIFSLIESKFILPAHLNQAPRSPATKGVGKFIATLQSKADGGLRWFIERVYRPMLSWVLKRKFAATINFLALVVLGYGLWMGGTIRSAMFPDIPGRYVQAEITLEQGAPLPLQSRSLMQLESAALQLSKALQRDYQLEKEAISNLLMYSDGYGQIEATIEMSAEALSRLPSNTILNRWQALAGEFEGAYAVSFSGGGANMGGTSLTVSAKDRELARLAVADLRGQLQQIAGVEDIYDDGQGGQPQLIVTLNDYGRQLGITQADIAQIAGNGFGEMEIHRLLHHGRETKVILKYRDDERINTSQLSDTPVFLQDGRSVMLGDVATFSFDEEPEILHRRNRSNVVNVYWRQDRTVQSPEESFAQLEPSLAEIETRYPGVKIGPAGEFEEIAEVQSGFKTAMVMTLLAIYALLAIPLKSYWQPLIIMAVIPFGFAGAIFGHGLLGMPVSILSLFGMMAMTGIVINDSLVLITRFNALYRSGMPKQEALITAGVSRVRAIFLTTVTTVCGLLPLLTESAEQAQYLKPAAVSLVFGEIFATGVTLLLIPLLLAIFTRKEHVPVEQQEQLILQ